MSGARSAEVKFEVEFSVPYENIWIKIEKNHPVKFAVEHGLQTDEIIGRLSLEKISY